MPLPPTAEAALASSLASLTGLCLHLRCACHKTIAPIDLMRRRCQAETLGAVMQRLRCPQCREQPSNAILATGYHLETEGMMGARADEGLVLRG